MSAPQNIPKVINLTEYSIPQLENLYQTLITQREQYVSMLSSMTDTNQKAEKAIDALCCMTPSNENNDILIPVSSSILVSGKLESVDHVYVSVGAGYVVEKTVNDASDFFASQTTLLDTNIKAIRSQAMNIEDQLFPMIDVKKLQQQQQEEGKEKSISS